MRNFINKCNLHNLKTLQRVYKEWQSNQTLIEWSIFPPFNPKEWKKKKRVSMFIAIVPLFIWLIPALDIIYSEYAQQHLSLTLSIVFAILAIIFCVAVTAGCIYIYSISDTGYAFRFATHISIDRANKKATIYRRLTLYDNVTKKIQYGRGQREIFPAFHLPKNIHPKYIAMRNDLQALITIETGCSFQDEFYYLHHTEKWVN